MFMAGHRGYGGGSQTHELVYARSIDAGRYDTTVWCDTFVTGSGAYSFVQPSNLAAFTTAQNIEAVPEGVASSGPNARAAMAMPVYSNRSFMTRAEVIGEVPAVSLGEADGLQVELPPALREAMVEGFVKHGKSLRRLMKSGSAVGSAPVDLGVAAVANGMVNVESREIYLSEQYAHWYGAPDQTTEEKYRAMTRVLIASHFDLIPDESGNTKPVPDDGMVHVFVLAHSDATFDLKSNVTVTPHAMTLYHFTFPSPLKESS